MLDPNTYSPNDGNNPSTDSSAVSKGTSQSSRTFLAKVFLYFGIQLLFTALLTFGLAYLFDYIFPFAGGSSSGTIFYIVMLIVSSIGMIVSLMITGRSMFVPIIQVVSKVVFLMVNLFISGWHLNRLLPY